MQYVKRIRIFTGMACNVSCRFCYYIGLHKDRTTENIKKQMDFAKKYGMEHIDFSGGEPTMRKDFVELVKYAKKSGFRTICTLTNGQKFVDMDFLKECVDAGLNEILFSVHGYSERNHDWLTQVPGSFQKLMKSVENAKELGIRFRTNTTVTKANYKNLTDHAKIFIKMKPLQSNFILFNDWDCAEKVAKDFSVKYSVASPYLKKAIDVMRNHVKYINVRYIPFCFMLGYEKYVCDYPQKIYDSFEWSQRLLSRFGDPLDFKNTLKHYGFIVSGTFKFRPSPKLNYKEYIEDVFLAYRRNTYVKPKEICGKCKFYNICDGLESSYAKIIGTNELKPQPGKKITDPIHFRRDFYGD